MSRNNGHGRGRRRGRRGVGGNRIDGACNHNDLPSGGCMGWLDPTDDELHFFNGLALIGAFGSVVGSARRGGDHRRPSELDNTLQKIYYTEDNFAVNTVYASFKPYLEEVTMTSVREMFEPFGPIKNIRIYQNQSNDYEDEEGASGGSRWQVGRRHHQDRGNRFGFIAFESCEHAAICLQQRRKLGRFCYVAKADSWHQEAYQEIHSKKENAKNATHTTSDTKDSTEDKMTLSGERPSEDECPSGLSNTAEVCSNSTDSNEEAQGTNILQLNDDCLMLIFEQVDLMEHIALKRTCARFQGIAENILKRHKFFDFDLYEDICLTMLNTRDILTEVGPHIEHLNISPEPFARPGTRILNLIPRHCLHLSELEIRDFTLNPKVLRNLEVVFRSLTALTLSGCGIGDNIEKNLANAKRLERVNLSSNSEITGKCFRVFKNLKYLNLESCQNIQGKPFSAFTVNNRRLEYLNINGCRRLTLEAIKSISTNLSELSELVCNNCYDSVDSTKIAVIGALPKLKKIQFIVTSFSQLDPIVQALGEVNQLEHLDLSDGIFATMDFSLLEKLTNLKVLKINYKPDFQDSHLSKLCDNGKFEELHIAGCSNITDGQMIKFIKKNPNLRLLDMSCCHISERLIFSAVDILREQVRAQTHGVRHPLKMIVGQSTICPELLKNALIGSSTHLLEVSFDFTPSNLGMMGPHDPFDDMLDDDDEDFMGYDYEVDDSDMWGVDYDSELDFADLYQYFYDSDEDEVRYLYM
ncbi:uncharacterized protein LOC129767370 [Toxorhynchites rutilus septentrionalis]|uniref:uncharacterized protein LOC129767370 n=1 Tax=Toxorhynchites rutilus septentrionalis TaxID=329112 RepID=UPI0024795F6E|nr:uncharacterized protein LOC129767370 [Toxorhynchites rutilus septentrionalis]